MNRYASPLITSPADMRAFRQLINRLADFKWLLALIALLAYFFPWITNHSSGLSFGGYDLAEWVSIHPDVRATQLMITPLLLRLQPCLIAWLVVLAAQHPLWTRTWWLKTAWVLITAVALLPPVEFLTIAREDINYRQQAIIALVTCLGGLVGLSGVAKVYHRWLLAGLVFIAITTVWIAVTQSYQLMDSLLLPVQVGIAPIIYTLLQLAILVPMFGNKQGDSPMRSALLQ